MIAQQIADTEERLTKIRIKSTKLPGTQLCGLINAGFGVWFLF